MEFNSPLTDEDWEKLEDVDFDHTEHIWFHTKHGKEVHFYKNAIPIEQLLSILPKYDDYIHFKTYPDNETMEDIYSKGYEKGWNACLKAIKEELEYWREEKELGID